MYQFEISIAYQLQIHSIGQTMEKHTFINWISMTATVLILTVLSVTMTRIIATIVKPNISCF